jgi:hypothetical protein
MFLGFVCFLALSAASWCFVLPSAALHFAVLYFGVLRFLLAVLRFAVLHFAVLRFSSAVLRFAVLYFDALHFAVLHFVI